jgi:hypothetical protein
MFMNGCGTSGVSRKRLQQQPLGYKAVQRRQPRDRQRPDQRQPRHPRHAPDQAAEPAEVALARCVQHRTGGEEQQALEHRVVQAVVQRGGERQRRGRAHTLGVEQQRQPDAREHDAEILDRRAGEQPLHVGLHRSEHHAVERTEQAERQQHRAPPPQRRRQQVEAHAQHAVDRGLQHHAAHQRRDRRRRGRMRLGQPHVQRHQPGLGAEAEHRQAEGEARARCGQLGRAHRVEGELPAAALQHAEAEQDRDRPDVREQQVEETGGADLGDAVLGRDEEIRGQRHRFPADHERVGVVGEQHQRHAGEEDVVLQAQQPGRGAFAGHGNSRPRTR